MTESRKTLVPAPWKAVLNISYHASKTTPGQIVLLFNIAGLGVGTCRSKVPITTFHVEEVVLK